MFGSNLTLAYITPMLGEQSNNCGLKFESNNRICHLTCCSVCTFMIVHRIIVCFLYCYIVEVSSSKDAAQTIFSRSQSKSVTMFQQTFSTCLYARLCVSLDKMWPLTCLVCYFTTICIVIIGYWLIFSLRTKVVFSNDWVLQGLLQVPKVHSPQAIWSITNFYTSISFKIPNQ